MPTRKMSMIGVHKKTPKPCEVKPLASPFFMPICYINCPLYLWSRPMLEFWFDQNVPLSRKLIFVAVLASITACLYWLNPLSLMSILLCLGTGLVFLICRYCKIHFTQGPTLFARVLHWIPIALLSAVLFMQLKQGDLLILGAQGIGFMALAVCLFSPLSLVQTQGQ